MRAVTQQNFTLPHRAKESHKGQHGRVLVIGGSIDLVGAVALAGIAALRSGVDLVVIAAPEKVAWAVNSLYPDLITKKLSGTMLTMRHWPILRKMAPKFDVILVGNGIGTSWMTKRLVNKLATLPNKKVFDADALTLVNPELLRETIVTPHSKEFEVMLSNIHVRKTHNMKDLRKRLAGWLMHGNVILKKGPEDIIIGPQGLKTNKTGNQGMTKGGTGDVLAGLCAGFYAQLKEPWHSALDAALINGKIGDLLKKKHKGYSYLASDMVNEIEKFI